MFLVFWGCIDFLDNRHLDFLIEFQTIFFEFLRLVNLSMIDKYSPQAPFCEHLWRLALILWGVVPPLWDTTPPRSLTPVWWFACRLIFKTGPSHLYVALELAPREVPRALARTFSRWSTWNHVTVFKVNSSPLTVFNAPANRWLGCLKQQIQAELNAHSDP